MTKETTDLMNLLDPEASKNWCVTQVQTYFWYGKKDDGQWRVQALGKNNQLLGSEDLNCRDGLYESCAKKFQALLAFIGQVHNSTDVTDLTAVIDTGPNHYLYRLSAWNAAGTEIFFWDFRDKPIAPTEKPECPKPSSAS